MAVYVDNAGIDATVGTLRRHWYHLVADTDAELHELAARIGLKPSWFQARCKFGGCAPCPHAHFDVTASKRAEAIRAGAQPIDIRQIGDVIRRRREAMRAGGQR